MTSLRKFLLLTLTFIGIHVATATPTNQNHFGTFQLPSIQVRPKFRYWLPDASISSDALAADLKEIGSIGAGGVEFLPFYNYGGALGPPATDWTKYGYGTPAYNALVKQALQTSKDNGLLMDLCMGPQSGQGVPASPDNPGLAYSLVYNYTTIAPGGTFKAKIPGFGLGQLISVTTAAILNESVALYPDQDYIITSSKPPFYNRTSFVISEKSLKDVTTSVSLDGILSVTFPTNEGAKKYIIFSAYYQLSLDRACVAATSKPQNILQNGSFAVDHFSVEGAKVTTDFLEKYIMVNGVRELFKEVGKYIWEDSVEVASEVYWTPKLKDTFYKLNGYDVGKYVMLFTINNGLSIGQNYPTSIKTDGEDGGQGFVEDYRNALTTSLQYYYRALAEWSKNYVGAEFSGQIGYNLPVDGSQVIPEVGAPEDESLAFDQTSSGSLDTYRQYVGPANLAGKRVISNEMGAAFNNVYKQTLPQLLHSAKRAWAVGNNQIVWHGAVFSGQFSNTTWPGFTSFGYLFSEPWSKHQPVWKNGFAEVNDFVGRTQWVLQSGIPQRDVAFWYKSQLNIVQDDSMSNNFTDLISAGYGYEFISPTNFDLPLAKVIKNKILAPDGPSYKALVLRSTDTLTLAGTQKIVQYAKQGLPIIIQGGIPNKIASANGLKQAQANIQNILSLKNVRQVGPGPLAPTLASMGIQPRAKVSGATWLTYWRYDRNAGVNYVFIFNEGTNKTSGTVTFQTTDKPFLLNAWTGTQEPILNYVVSRSDKTTTIPLTISAGQTILIAFKSHVERIAAPQTYITAATVPILGYVYKQPNSITIKVPMSSANGFITLSNSNTVYIPPQQARAPITLRNWHLIAESWTPSPSFFDSNSIGTKTNKTFTLPDLASWPDIPGLANTSGIGYYSNFFTWEPSSDGSGAFIDFGAIQNTVRVRVNDKSLPPLDLSNASADISAYLQRGRNTIEAIAATTLYNALVPIYPQLSTGGTHPTFGPGLPGLGGVPSVPAGLLETVVITPYNLVRVS